MTVREIIADKILQLLQSGSPMAWVKPWRTIGAPRSLTYRREYSGVNRWLLLGETQARGYTSPWWATFNQIAKLGGIVRRGEKSVPVVLWKRTVRRIESADGIEEDRQSFLVRYYRVFNTDQTEGLNVPPQEVTGASVVGDMGGAQAVLDAYCSNLGPRLEHRGDAAFYTPATDVITLPTRERFTDSAAYYATAFHEATHSTGHASRLNRDAVTSPIAFASHAYSAEELVAEFGAAMLCAETGVEASIENHAAYIAGWNRVLVNDPGAVLVGASRADKAVDYILGRTHVTDDEAA